MSEKDQMIESIELWERRLTALHALAVRATFVLGSAWHRLVFPWMSQARRAMLTTNVINMFGNSLAANPQLLSTKP